MSFLSCLYDKTKRQLKKRHLFVIFLDIFLLCRKDDLKKIIFNYLLVFCAVWNMLL